MTGAALRLRSVSRSFGSVRALRDADVEVRRGEVHALVGENGAGKSTLLKVVSGLLVPDAGVVEVDGVELVPGDRSASLLAGVGVVHQHFSLVETMTGVENFELGRPDAGRRINRSAARRLLQQWGERTGLSVETDVAVEELSIGERQRLEILTTLGWGAKVLLLDEPTAVLSPVDADGLLEVVCGLARDGLSVVLVTHKLREVERFADRVTVLRAGAVVGRHRVPEVSKDDLVAEMVGDGAEDAVLYAGDRAVERTPGDPVLRVNDLEIGRLRGVSLELAGGHVTGIAAVVGSGQAELIGAICGLIDSPTGAVEINTPNGTVSVAGDPGRATRSGVALIPEDRERDGIASGLPVWTNAVAKSLDRIGGRRGVDRSAVRAITSRVIASLGVRPATPTITAGQLSGGNQQRLVIGRELDRAPRVVLAVEPTRGLDPASALAVIDALRAAAADGAAVLVAASDLDELLLMSDRVLAMCDGHITFDAPIADVERTRLGRAMAGVS